MHDYELVGTSPEGISFNVEMNYCTLNYRKTAFCCGGKMGFCELK